MRAGGSPGHWSEILAAARPDVLFVQETKAPAAMASDLEETGLNGLVWAPVDHGRWGSAVLIRGCTIRNVDGDRRTAHCDGVFLPTALTESVDHVRVLADSPWTELSDHNPVLVDWRHYTTERYES